MIPSDVTQRPTSPPQPVSPSTAPDESPLPTRTDSLGPTPSTLPPRPASSPAIYPDDEDDNASPQRPAVHFSNSARKSSPAVLTNHGRTSKPTLERVPSWILKGVTAASHDSNADVDEVPSPQYPSRHRHRHRRRSRVSPDPSPSPRSPTPPITPYFSYGAEHQYPYVSTFGGGGASGAPQVYSGTALPPGAYVGHLPQNVPPGSVPITQDQGIVGSGARGPCPNMAHAAGLQVYTTNGASYYYSTAAQQPWVSLQGAFPLKAFRGSDYTILYIEPSWDDEELLRELRKTYNSLRGLWRRCFSLKNVQ